MPEFYIILVFLLVALGAAFYFWYLWRQSEIKATTATEEQIRATAQLQAAEQDKDELHTARQKLNDNAARIAELETELQNERKNTEEKNELLKKTEKEMSDRFENLAQKIFTENSRQFNEDSKRSLEPLLTPLKQNIEEFRRRADVLHSENTKERAALKEHIESLNANTAKISSDAENLTRALKGDKKMQGNWGELTLQRLLEESGLQQDVDYKAQPTLHNDDGAEIIPDFVIYLPGKKHLIADSKVSLIAYEKYVNAADDETRKAALKLHIQAVESHVARLASKFYAHAAELNAPDFVFLFMPIEPALLTALQNAPDLFNKSYKRKIVLTSPTTFLAILRTVAHIWKAELQQQNAAAIAEQGGKLYNKFHGFVEDMEKIGRHIDATKKTYDDANKKLSGGHGDLIGQANKLLKMGVTAKKQLSDKYDEESPPPLPPPAAE